MYFTGKNKTVSVKELCIDENSSMINHNNELISLKDICNRYIGQDLPFVLKLLSIKKPSPIQLHPDNICSQILNKRFPTIYNNCQKTKLDTHGQLVISLSKMTMLVGFRPISEILINIARCIELRNILGKDIIDDAIEKIKIDDHQAGIKILFDKLVKTDIHVIEKQSKLLIERILQIKSDCEHN